MDAIGSGGGMEGSGNREEIPCDGLRLLLVEDHPHVRQEFIDASRTALRFAEVQAAKDLPDGLDALERFQPSVLVVDIGLPSGSGLHLIRSAQMVLGDRCQSVLLTVTGNDEFLLRAVKCGACGVIYKSDIPSLWWGTIAGVLAGGSPVSAAVAQAALEVCLSAGVSTGRLRLALSTRKVAELVASGYSLEEVVDRTGQTRAAVGKSLRELYVSLLEQVPRLTARELELIRLLGKGNGFKQCATLMGVGEATTKTLAMRAYSKLGANNLQTALYEARTLGLLT